MYFRNSINIPGITSLNALSIQVVEFSFSTNISFRNFTITISSTDYPKRVIFLRKSDNISQESCNLRYQQVLSKHCSIAASSTFLQCRNIPWIHYRILKHKRAHDNNFQRTMQFVFISIFNTCYTD